MKLCSLTGANVDDIVIRLFGAEDTESLVELICRNLLEVNIKDYDQDSMEQLANTYNADKIKTIAKETHLYVACLEDKIIGSGAIMPKSEHESLILTVFVLPEMQGYGIGKKIIGVLENDHYFLQAKKVVLFSSITAIDFYLKLGYKYQKGYAHLEADELYILEKIISSK